jgi:hypothetical protein
MYHSDLFYVKIYYRQRGFLLIPADRYIEELMTKQKQRAG